MSNDPREQNITHPRSYGAFLADEDSHSGAKSQAARAVILAVGLALTLGVGFLDYHTGYEISFSVFYMAPTAFLAWKGGRGAGLIGAVAGAAVWLHVEVISGHTFSQPWIIYWNTFVRLVFFVVTAQLISQQQRVLSLERSLSGSDHLTGLMNGRSFFREGETVRALCARHARPLTVIYMDLDDFKKVNDSRGHQEGDHLLQLVGRGLQRAARASDLVARLGGDEFALLLPETGHAESERFISRLRSSLEAEIDRTLWPIGYSVGAVTFPTPPADLETAIAMADRMMYEVKGEGKDRWLHRTVEPEGTRRPAAPEPAGRPPIW